MYVYQDSRETGVFTVGFFDPAGEWHAETDHADPEDAAKRTAWLNGSGRAPDVGGLKNRIKTEIFPDPQTEGSESWNAALDFVLGEIDDEYLKW